MRYLVYSLLVSVFMVALFSCTDSKQNQEEEKIILMKANWSDTIALSKAIDVFYKDSVVKQGKIALEVRDPFMNSRTPNQYLQLQKILRPQFKKTSSTIGYMPVLMMGLSDSVIVDFQVTWTQVAPTDSTGKFVVTDVFLQRVGKELRYEWVKEEEYWIRKNVEMSEGNRKKEKLDPKILKKMQENNVI